jgi:hypothetical protein
MPKFIFLLCLLFLPVQGASGSDFPYPIRDISLNVNLIQNNSDFLAADKIGIIVEAGMETYYKLNAHDEIIACGQLVSGNNTLLLTWPGMFAKTQTLPFMLEIKAGPRLLQKMILITVTVAGSGEQTALPEQAPAGAFTVRMFLADQLIGFRKKTMTDLITLTTGLVTAVDDPALSGSAIRSVPPSQSVSIFGLAMGIAKYLAGKKLTAAKKTTQVNSQKHKMSVVFYSSDKNGEKKTVQATIELQTD